GGGGNLQGDETAGMRVRTHRLGRPLLGARGVRRMSRVVATEFAPPCSASLEALGDRRRGPRRGEPIPRGLRRGSPLEAKTEGPGEVEVFGEEGFRRGHRGGTDGLIKGGP